MTKRSPVEMVVKIPRTMSEPLKSWLFNMVGTNTANTGTGIRDQMNEPNQLKHCSFHISLMKEFQIVILGLERKKYFES